MPYPRYGGGPGYGNNGGTRRDDYRGNRGYNPGGGGGGGGGPMGGGMPSPWQGGNPGGLLPTPGGGGNGNNLALALGSLLGSAGPGGGGQAALANLAGQLALAQSMGGGGGGGYGGGPMGGYGGGGGPMRRDRDMRLRRGDRSPPRRPFRRSRSRSPARNRMRNSDGERGRGGSKRLRDSSPPRDRPEHEIYIGNYPVKFREQELRKLFEENGVEVKTIRMKHDGLKVFAFAETISKEEIQKAVAAIDSKEINGRRLRVRPAGDKEPKGPVVSRTPARRELTVDDVKRHLAFAFNGFLDREMALEGAEEEKVEQMRQARDLIKTAFQLPEDDSLKISRDLELIFMQNNRREIKVAPTEEELQAASAAEAAAAKTIKEEEGENGKTDNDVDHSKEGQDDGDAGEEKDDGGNWKRRKLVKDEEEEEEEEEDDEDHGKEDFPEPENVPEFADGNEEEEEDVGGGEESEVKVEDEEMVTLDDDEDDDVANAIEENEEEEEVAPAQASPSRGGARGRGGRGGNRARRARGRRS